MREKKLFLISFSFVRSIWYGSWYTLITVIMMKKWTKSVTSNHEQTFCTVHLWNKSGGRAGPLTSSLCGERGWEQSGSITVPSLSHELRRRLNIWKCIELCSGSNYLNTWKLQKNFTINSIKSLWTFVKQTFVKVCEQSKLWNLHTAFFGLQYFLCTFTQSLLHIHVCVTNTWQQFIIIIITALIVLLCTQKI